MSGNASAIKCRLLSRASGSPIEVKIAPLTQKITLNRDVRRFSGSFDLEMQFGPNTKLPVTSHDFVEFYFDGPNGEFQIGVGFFEDFLKTTSPEGLTVQANGRDLIGQLLNIPYKQQNQYKGLDLYKFAGQTVADTYLKEYLDFRGGDLIVDRGAYQSTLSIVTDVNRKRGAILQEYADLAINLIYQNKDGQLEIYGRTLDASGGLSVPKACGTFIKASGKSNFCDLSVRSDFTKVISECTVMWVAAQANLAATDINGPLIQNTDPRAQSLFQPDYKVFSAQDLVLLRGGQAAEQRMEQIAKSLVRKSNANLNQVVVTVKEPYFTDPTSQSRIEFDVMQIWHVLSEEDGLDQDMIITGLSYQEDEGDLTLQIALSEPDTLI